MKRNKLFIAGLLVAFVAVLSLTLVSGTWARYATKVTSAQTQARAAKWQWTVDKVDASNKIEFDLFSTIKDSDLTNSEADVATGGGENIIAPGTSGSFEFTVTNKSEVSGKAVLKFTVDNGTDDGTTPLPLKFKVDGEASWVEVSSFNGKSYEVTLDWTDNEAGTAHNFTIQWIWEFGSSDDPTDTTNVSDTTIGTNALTTPQIVRVSMEAKFVQVD